MDHLYIDEQQVADRYVMGTLSEEEAERFEDHSFTCPDCLDRIAVARSMRRGFQRVAREDAVRLASARQLAFVAWLARLGRSRQIGVLLLALLVVAVLPAGLSLRMLAEHGRDQEEAREAERQRSRAVQEAARYQSELEQSRSELIRQREARAEAEERLDRALQDSVNAPVLYLEAERSAGPGSLPTQQLRQPEVPVELAVDPSFPSYRVGLKNTQGREIWSRTGLRLTRDDTLRFNVPASLLPPGDYTFAAQGTSPDGALSPAGRFPCRVLPPA